MGEKISRFLRGQVATSVIYILLGAALAFLPVESVNVICKIVFGIILILAGAYHIIFFLLEKSSTTMLDLFSGVILVVFGVFLFYNPQIIIRLLPTLLGGFVLVDVVWTVRDAIRLKRAGSGLWKWLLIGALVFLVLGIAMIVNPFTVVRNMVIFGGAVLLTNGVLDLIFQIMLYGGIKTAKKRMEEAEKEQEESMSSQEHEDYTDWNHRDTGIPETGAGSAITPEDTAHPGFASPEPELTLEPDLEIEEPDLGIEEPDLEIEESDLGIERPDFGIEVPDSEEGNP